MKAIIIDDEKKSREVLRRLLSEIETNIEIIGEAGSVKEGYDSIIKLKPDLIFLDIEMLDGTGFNLLEKFATVPFEVIFTTAYDQYAIKAFKYSALDYLLKPINVDELDQATKKFEKYAKPNQFDNQLIQNLLQNLAPNSPKRIALKSANKIDYINVNDILYCSTSLSATEFKMTEGRTITSIRPLKDFEQLLDNHFFRISKFHLVNINQVSSYKKDSLKLKMLDGMELDVSRRTKKEFLDFMESKLRN